MASKKDKEFLKSYINRELQLNRNFEKIATQNSGNLKKATDALIDRFSKKYSDLKTADIVSIGREIQNEIDKVYREVIIPAMDDGISEIVLEESEFIAGTLTTYTGTTAAVSNPVNAANKALAKTIDGHTLDFWMRREGKQAAKRAKGIIKTAFENGATVDEVLPQMRKVMQKSDAHVRTLTRSFLQSSAAEARYDTFSKNEELLEGYYWVSVLDNRTTAHICGVRDTLFFDTEYRPVDHMLDWGLGPGRIHFNCRSTFIPKVKGGFDLLDTLERPAINAGSEYQKGDKQTRAGKVRKPTKYNRDNGYYKVSQVKGGTAYDEWLKKQKLGFIRDALGESEDVAKEFQKGNLTLLQIAQQNQQQINLGI